VADELRRQVAIEHGEIAVEWFATQEPTRLAVAARAVPTTPKRVKGRVCKIATGNTSDS
jgi:hypothetical protein